MRRSFATGFGLLIAVAGASATTAAGAALAPASYHVRLVGTAPPKLSVTADLPIDGTALTMDTTRPAGIAGLDARGWPSLVSHLEVRDDAGGSVEAADNGAAGWQLAEARSGRLRIAYDVDYAALAALGWPAPREAGLVDPEHLVLVGRSMFVTTPALGESLVTFDLPEGWRPFAPWQPMPRSKKAFSVSGAGDLVENLIVFARSAPDVVTAGGLRLQVVPMGQWEPAHKDVRRVLGAVIPRLVALAGVADRENYLVVLLPVVERGGESYRHSFAMTFDVPPSRANCAVWGNTIAHEVFHLWNGWKLHGADYATSQWFEEGFTEYAANLAMVGAKLIDANAFLQKLSDHVTNYRTLTTTLEGSGTHKGPPLYAAGALVAFTWDVRILHSTDGKRGFSDVFHALWKQTDQGRKAYSWPDIRAALEATAPYDWDAYYAAYIQGAKPLPLKNSFGHVGVGMIMAADDTVRLTLAPNAPASAKALWQTLVGGR